MADLPFNATPGGDAQKIRVEALGEPGQRRFRLLAAVHGETHVVWMEKQQLQALGLAIEQMLEQLPDEGPILADADAPLEFDDNTQNQFRVGKIELGFDATNNRIVISAHDIQEDEAIVEDVAALNVRLTRGQAHSLSAEAATVVAAGRPRCPMCGSPMGPGPHVCPQQNGHLPLTLEDDEPE